ncbi:MAG TPA: BatD family protein, partial [Spirochaetia bacterium]|nr:BatD family protein [Spirochaetia bacterium]
MSHRTGSHLRGLRLFFVLALGSIPSIQAFGIPGVEVRAIVGSGPVVVGGSVELQIQIQGSDRPGKPAFPPLAGARVSFEGGSSNDSTSITILNGNQSTVVTKGYVFTYSIDPTRAGRITIPPVVVSVAGRDYQTEPLTLNASTPTKTRAFLFRLSLPAEPAYVGEPIVLTADWYISMSVSSVQFHLPILNNPAFESKSMAVPGGGAKSVQIPLGNGSATALRMQATVDGRPYTLIQFKRL